MVSGTSEPTTAGPAHPKVTTSAPSPPTHQAPPTITTTSTVTMPKTPPRCGTISGWTRHQTSQPTEPPCPACKAAKARYDAERWLRRKAAGQTSNRRKPLTMQDVAQLIRTRQSLEKRLNVTSEVARALQHAARQNGYL